MSKPPRPAPIASAMGPSPTIIQISRTPRHWKFTQRLRTNRPPPLYYGHNRWKAELIPDSKLYQFTAETASLENWLG